MTRRGAWLWPVGRLLIAALVGMAAVPAVAGAQNCPEPSPSYMGACGPTFEVPSWTDAGGWTDPSQYSTIQLADVNGDGRDELLGRSDAGLQIWWFDTSVGQWRPQVDANAVPQILTDFRSPRPGETLATDPTEPEYYSTIQAADVDGRPGAEILARFADGMRLYQYTSPAGSTDIDGGTWTRIGTGGPFSDADGYGDPSLYATIQVGQFIYGNPPLLFARIHSKAPDASLAFYAWQNGAWSPRVVGPDGLDISGLSDQECGQPSCYLDLQTANVAPPEAYYGQSRADEVLARGYGAQVWDFSLQSDGWFRRQGSGSPNGVNPMPPVFADVPSPDCPFSTAGASGDGSGDCLGSSPSYYETMQAADVDGLSGGQDELLARASDGLRVYKWTPEGQLIGQGKFVPGATLPALAGAASDVRAGLWGSIRTGDISKDGRDEVLALDASGGALQAWSYDPTAQAWRELLPSTALTLTGDWLTDPEYYATIQVGDVDGDGRDDVIGRGPYGIRTWFYDRRGTGGWERYLPEGYQPFPTAGQQAAFTELTQQAKANSAIPQTASSVRDVWTGENPPSQSDLTTLQGKLGQVGSCTGPSVAQPPSYQTCTPPATSTGFTSADWTAVINEMLAESYAAYAVVGFFVGPSNSLTSIRENLFIAEGAELPAIGDALELQAAANTPTSFDVQNLFAGIVGIGASLADLGDPEPAAAMWLGSELASTIPAASPTAMSDPLQTTYSGLQDKFATMVTEIDASIPVQHQLVRQDAGLLELVGELYSRGTWALDTIGIGSAANQAFASWAYSALVPTVYDRYHITNCSNGFDYGNGQCTAPTGLGVVGGGQDFTMIGPRHQLDQYGAEQVPCMAEQDYSGTDDVCTWNTPPADLMNRIWGPVSPGCSYVPGQSDTVWTFGCSAGVDPATSIGDNSWGFPSYAGDPDPYNAPGGFSSSAAAARPGAAARVRRLAPIRLGRPRHGHRRAVRGRAQVRGGITVPRGMRLTGATVRLDRLLFDRRGRGELARPYGGRASRPVKLRLKRRAPGRFTAATAGRRSVRVTVRRVGRRGRARLTLRLGAKAFRAPRACHALPAANALKTPRLYLDTRLVISHGRIRHRVRLEHHVRCVRDARGNVDRLVRVRNRSFPARRGLAVSVDGPRRVQPGAVVRYVARLRNRRRSKDRLISSLWDVALNDGTRTTRIRELRRGRARRVSVFRRVPRATRSRFCVHVGATAAGARAADARVCAVVRAARP